MAFDDQPPPCPAGELAGIVVPLRVGSEWAWISEEDQARCAQYKWQALRLKHTTYAMTKVKRIHPTRGVYKASLYLHRLIKNASPGEVVDHEIRNGLYCWRANLRVTTDSGNNQNKVTGKVPFRGVTVSGTGRYRSRIKDLQGVQLSMGTFDTPEEAARVFDRAAFLLYGRDYLGFNFPDEVIAWAIAEGHIKPDAIPVSNRVAQSDGAGYESDVPF